MNSHISLFGNSKTRRLDLIVGNKGSAVKQQLRVYLEDLMHRIEEKYEESELRKWQNFLDDCIDGVFISEFRKVAEPKVQWPDLSLNSAIDDSDIMVYHQFKMCSDILKEGSCRKMNVRCNYGTGILPTMFGCKLFMMDELHNELPAAMPLGSREKVKFLIDKGVPDLNSGLAGKVFQTAEKFLDVFDKYPFLAKNIAFCHPDMQGPIDAAEVIWGSDIFYAFYDDTKLLEDFLRLITDTYISFMKKWFMLVPQHRDYSTHWGFMFKGKVMIRNDSLMNLSAQSYIDIIRPFDQRILEEFGGAIHFCGRGDHYIEAVSSLNGLTAINLAQPELNDMDIIYRNTVDKKIKLIGLRIDAIAGDSKNFKGQLHCFPNPTKKMPVN